MVNFIQAKHFQYIPLAVLAMKFENDIFISYKSSDDQYDDMYSRWISEFIQHTEALLQKYFQYSPKIILSDNLPESEAEKLIENTALYIPILSTETLTSDYNNELELIRNALINTGFEEKPSERVLLAYRSCLSPDLIPKFLQGAEEFDFCKLQAEYFFKNEVTDDEVKELFWMNMVNLAYRIFEKLQKLKAQSDEKVDEQFPSVYLVPATPDKKLLRMQIAVELKHAGFNVLPEEDFDVNLLNAKNIIKEKLNGCVAYLQLAGEKYGDIPRDSNYSLQDIHLRTVTEYNDELEQRGEKRIPQIFYVLPGLRTHDETQAKFIGQVRENAQIYRNTEFYEGSFVRFRSFCSNLKSRIIATNTQTISTGTKKVYVASAKLNGELQSIKNFFENLPGEFSFQEDDSNCGYLHHWNLLMESDIIMIYANDDNTLWLEARLAELQKLQAVGKANGSASQKVVYLAGKHDIPGELIPMNAKIIRDPNGFNAKHLNFLAG